MPSPVDNLLFLPELVCYIWMRAIESLDVPRLPPNFLTDMDPPTQYDFSDLGSKEEFSHCSLYIFKIKSSWFAVRVFSFLGISNKMKKIKWRVCEKWKRKSGCLDYRMVNGKKLLLFEIKPPLLERSSSLVTVAGPAFLLMESSCYKIFLRPDSQNFSVYPSTSAVSHMAAAPFPQTLLPRRPRLVHDRNTMPPSIISYRATENTTANVADGVRTSVAKEIRRMPGAPKTRNEKRKERAKKARKKKRGRTIRKELKHGAGMQDQSEGKGSPRATKLNPEAISFTPMNAEPRLE